MDDYTSPLGFRWFKFTADQGFSLNGEHRYFKGANVHQRTRGCAWTERIVTVSQTKLTFPPKGNWHYHVEISDDGDNGWKSLGESKIRGEGIVDTIKLVKGMTGRFLRVRFVGESDATFAALAELEVRGSLSLQ